MLVQDNLGYVHEVPDSQYGEVLYDGLGNPVGLFPALAAALPAIGGLVSSALPAIAGALPGVGSLVGKLFGGGAPAPSAPLPIPAPPFPGMVPPPPLPNFMPQIGRLLHRPFPFRQCTPPVGWTTPALPYTGPQPRRMYLRCSVWPGQSGLVPVAPGTWPTPPGMPGVPGMPGMPGVPGMPVGIRRRRHGRRRR